jgi:manganese oxidase
MAHRVFGVLILTVTAALVPEVASASSAPRARTTIVTHDNRQAAGALVNGTLRLDLRAQAAFWRPEGDAGRTLRVEAFGEGAAPPSVPAPLIRIPEGTLVSARVSNELDHPLRVHGLCDRGALPCAPLDVPPGESRCVEFKSGPPGTYHYWATTTGMPQTFRGADDTQLSGAFIVDLPGTAPNDRVFVVTEWTSLTREQLAGIGRQDDPGAAFLKLRPDVLFLINGRSWPHTERLTYRLGEPVRWRVVNLSTQVHPMHLHGFYFEVGSTGDGLRQQTFDADHTSSVVTHLLQPGATMAMRWTPEREGNWLFHCHVMTHVSPVLHVDGSPKETDGHQHDDGSAGMSGMVLGVTVMPAANGAEAAPETVAAAPRRMTLLMRTDPHRFGDEPAFGFELADRPEAVAANAPLQVPGPVLVLTRGEPVEITLVNQLPEATSIHWHGMELESYYDGVHGWGGTGLRKTPMIEPGGSFAVRFTPPRAGTFMYHTHLHDHRQLTSGLYGAMLVVEPEAAFDEATDHVFVMGRHGPQAGAPVALNGTRELSVTWRSGTRHRVRLCNITPDDTLSVTLQSSDGPVNWRPVAKDGAPVPEARSQPGPARQIIGVGETYDFEFEAPARRQTLWLEVRSPGGKWQAQGRVIVK